MNDEMQGQSEDAILAAIKLHVTGNLTLIRAAEEELVKNKVPTLKLCFMLGKSSRAIHVIRCQLASDLK